jgi:hypothetical protein
VTLDAVFSPDLYRRVELRTDHDNAFFNGVRTENEMTGSSLSLQMLAHQSGGLVLIDGKDLAAEIAQCVADAQLYYALSFELPPAVQPRRVPLACGHGRRPGADRAHEHELLRRAVSRPACEREAQWRSWK